MISKLKSKIKKFEEEKLLFLEDSAKLSKLYNMGIIDSAGEPLYGYPEDDDHEEKQEEIMRF